MRLEQKKYSILDVIIIPFRANPLTVTTNLLLSVFNGLVPYFLVKANTTLINTIINYVNKNGGINDIFNPLLKVFILIAYLYVYGVVSEILYSKSEIGLRETFIVGIIEKQVNLKYEHRLGSVKAADRIIVLDGGRIIEDGTHEDLMKNNGSILKCTGLKRNGIVDNIRRIHQSFIW